MKALIVTSLEPVEKETQVERMEKPHKYTTLS